MSDNSYEYTKTSGGFTINIKESGNGMIAKLLSTLLKIVTRTIGGGCTGLVLGIVTLIFFKNNMLDPATGSTRLIAGLLAFLYYIFGTTLLAGTIGFQTGIAKAVERVLFEFGMFPVVISGVLMSVIHIIRKMNGAKTDPAEITGTLVTMEMIKKALDKFRGGKGAEKIGFGAGGATRPLGSRLGKRLLRLMFSNNSIDVLEREIKKVFSGRNTITFSELRDSMAQIGETSGVQMVRDIYSEKIILLAIVIPFYLALPFGFVLLLRQLA